MRRAKSPVAPKRSKVLEGWEFNKFLFSLLATHFLQKCRAHENARETRLKSHFF
jgi:hypothetical protein